MASNGLIVSAVIVTAGSGFIVNAVQKKAPSFNQFLASGIMGGFLFAIDAINDDVGRLLCELIILGVLLRHGDTLFAWVGNKTQTQTVSTNGPIAGRGAANNGPVTA